MPEFAGDGARTYLPFDYIAMSPSALTAHPAQHTVEDCQAACRAADDAKRGCQYFVFLGYAPPAKRCALRLAGVAPASFAPGDAAPKVLFEVSCSRSEATWDGSMRAGPRPPRLRTFCPPHRCLDAEPHPPLLPPSPNPPQLSPNRYSAYYGVASDWASLGVDQGAFATLEAARASCAASAPCIGIKYSPAGGAKPFKTFAGSLMEDVVGKVGPRTAVLLARLRCRCHRG
jgi:hypothetical protein